MSVFAAVARRLFAVPAILLLAACGGGGGGGGGGGAGDASGGNSGPGLYAQPARYSASSYSQFTSQKGTTDLTGTWIMLIDGVMANGQTPVVTGRNYTESHQYYARAIVRINNDPRSQNAYYVYSCGPGGARDTSTAYTPGATSLYLPYFYFSTGSYTSYPISIVDAVTLRNTNVIRDWAWYGSSGWAMSYALSFTYKRISDDPFANVASVTDLNSSQVTNAGCLYEAEGAYTATENDTYVQGFYKSGTFYIADAYSVSQLNNNVSSYSNLIHLQNMSNYLAGYWRNNVSFNTQQGDTVTPTVSVNSNSSSYTVHAVKGTNAGIFDDARLDLNP